MDDEDRIILAGIGVFGALTYIAIKKLQEKESLESNEDKSSSNEEKEQEPQEGFKKEKKETKSQIYKELLKLTLGNKPK